LDVFDVIVVGGGPAGLSAALMLGRCRRRVLVCDQGHPRNRQSRALHGYLTRDGIAPLDLQALGRSELARYGVQVLRAGVIDAVREKRGFRVTLGDGQRASSRFLLLATGVADDLPPVPGLEACYGRSAHHCPYCDAWEWRDRRLAVLGGGGSAVRLALSLKTWSADVALCANGQRVDRRVRDRLARNDVAVRTPPVASLQHEAGCLRAIAFRDGDTLPCDALFFVSLQHPQCNLAERLGCARSPHGTVHAGRLSETDVAGVFVAGDLSRDARFVVIAAAEGVKAAVAINQALQREELAP
jgi:thioredoxin reductase